MVGCSTNGRLVVPIPRYCASKWAVHGFCASLRTELLEAYGDKAPKVRTRPGVKMGDGPQWVVQNGGSYPLVNK